MMASQTPLQPLLDLMQSRVDEATRQLGRLIAAEQDAKRKLALLSNYRDEYAGRFNEAAKNGLSPHEWRNYQDFLARLDDAIAHQHQVVAASELNVAAGQKNWQEQRNHHRAIDTLAQRRHEEETTRANRREQKMLDEIAAKNARDKLGLE